MPYSPLSVAPTGPVVVIGGANVDILGVPDAALVPGDSNPGRVELSPGGVGRNIAENLARLGVATQLITVLGGDANGRFLAEECARAGVDIAYSLVLADEPGPLYVAILDASGDMALALNDMRAMERLTPDVLEPRAFALARAALVVVDTNLPAETLAWIGEYAPAPLILDAISVAKAPRALPILHRLAALHCNALEAGALLGREVVTHEDAEQAARELVALGAGRVFVTLGAGGVVAADSTGPLTLSAPPATLINATGAGDAFTAGIALAQLAALPLRDSAQLGCAMAAIAMASERTVSETVSIDTVNR
ncbi:MAG: carbohydrate kinase family protein, partial [Coriobacteriia bacterium]|nr:carbohydrate kinase family protein [Coriobacteriia bacterium]